MSEQAFEVYQKSQTTQRNRNEARRIRTRVNEARRSPHTAGIRWPFELLQNALDAGPRPGNESVTVTLRQGDHEVIFEHDGAPFTSQELAALLSGGSSKEFESELTTGRFGTGFLVTHVLAERTTLDGLLVVDSGHERFSLTLDRGGDEEAILANILACNDAIRAAVPVGALDGVPSAKFVYSVDRVDTLALGLESFRQALPYLFATRPTLGQVTIQSPDGTREEWTPSPVRSEGVTGGLVYLRDLTVDGEGDEYPVERRVLRFVTRSDAHASALLLLNKQPVGWDVVIPERGQPRIYREYPLRASGFLPVNFVFDGKFDPDQERSRLLMSDDDRRLIQESFAAAVVGATRASAERWGQAHHLARAAAPTSTFDPGNADEKAWWVDQLTSFASRLAALPLVDTEDGMLPAVSEDGPFADFVVPRLAEKSASDETSVERLWPLVSATTHLWPPRADIAADWTATARGWDELGVKLNLITLHRLADEARSEEPVLDELRVEGDRREWLARFFDVVGECWKARGTPDVSIFENLVPDQSGRLSSPDGLRQDAGVSERLKDICGGMGLDVRASLLDTTLLVVGQRLSLSYLATTLNTAVKAKASEADVIDECLDFLDESLPLKNGYTSADEPHLHGSARLLDYLFQSQGKDAEESAKRVPFVTADDKVVRWTVERMLMAPVPSWPAAARPFCKAYPPDRVLADDYAGVPDKKVPDVTAALAAWGVAHAQPVTTNTPSELKERRLAALAVDKSQASGAVVSGFPFSQIALLQPELINRCRAGFDEARALLGLVLCYVAPNDPGWREIRTVTGRKGGKDVRLDVRGALWLADLLFQAWVPVADVEGKLNQMTASAPTLRGLLDPAWLEHNDSAIALLSRWFEFDELDLRLLGSAPDEGRRRELRNGLARLVESAGADPRTYADLAREIEARRNRGRDVARCRRFGLAVQEAIRAALAARQVSLTLIDHGYDFEVLPPSENVLTDAGCRLDVGPYLLEIKATTTGQARMTPAQAATASTAGNRYVLCVVDLREVPDERLDSDWTPADVEPLAVLVPDIATEVAATFQHVEQARGSDVAIRNEAALRYEVPPGVWGRGFSIGEWVGRICVATAPEQPAAPPPPVSLGAIS